MRYLKIILKIKWESKLANMPEMCKGGLDQKPPVVENFGAPPHRRAKRSENF